MLLEWARRDYWEGAEPFHLPVVDADAIRWWIRQRINIADPPREWVGRIATHLALLRWRPGQDPRGVLPMHYVNRTRPMRDLSDGLLQLRRWHAHLPRRIRQANCELREDCQRQADEYRVSLVASLYRNR
jgi:hypothetical protein